MAITLQFKNVNPDLVSADQHTKWGHIFDAMCAIRDEIIDYTNLCKLPT